MESWPVAPTVPGTEQIDGRGGRILHSESRLSLLSDYRTADTSIPIAADGGIRSTDIQDSVRVLGVAIRTRSGRIQRFDSQGASAHEKEFIVGVS